MKKLIKVLSLMTLIFLLSACEQLRNAVSHTAVTVDTNANYSAYQKTSADSWKVIAEQNSTFGFKTNTFTVDDPQSAYGLVFVCPSERADLPHEVHVYYSTEEEMELIDFNCRKSLDDIIEKPIYGTIKGVKMAELDGSANPEGEFVKLAVAKDLTLDAWEAYAVMVRTGTRDIVGLKGKQSVTGVIKPEKFLIRRRVQLAASAVPLILDVDFSDDSFLYFSRAFNENARSNVNILGRNDGDVIRSSLSFISRYKTVLNLETSTQDSFSFLPVPLDEYTETINDFTEPSEFNPGEGHELIVSEVSVASENKEQVNREVSKFFTNSEGINHEMVLPKAISNQPLVALRNVGDMQSIVLNWKDYQDSAVGKTRLYRWEIEGLAAAPLEKKLPKKNIEQVKWFVSVTPGWLKAVGDTDGNHILIIPTHYKKGASGGEVSVDDSWLKEWGFKHTTSVSWKMSAVSVAHTNTAQEVIDYLLNRNISDNLQFSQVFVHSKTEVATP